MEDNRVNFSASCSEIPKQLQEVRKSQSLWIAGQLAETILNGPLSERLTDRERGKLENEWMHFFKQEIQPICKSSSSGTLLQKQYTLESSSSICEGTGNEVLHTQKVALPSTVTLPSHYSLELSIQTQKQGNRNSLVVSVSEIRDKQLKVESFEVNELGTLSQLPTAPFSATALPKQKGKIKKMRSLLSKIFDRFLP